MGTSVCSLSAELWGDSQSPPEPLKKYLGFFFAIVLWVSWMKAPLTLEIGALGSDPQVGVLKVVVLDAESKPFAPHREAGGCAFPPKCTSL